MRCDDHFRADISARLNDHERWCAPVPAGNAQPLSQAAVAVTVVEQGFGADVGQLPSYAGWQDTATLLLTRRSQQLRNHPGQWAFPGGRSDPGETPIDTALREMWEEVGLELPQGEVLGMLDDFVTHSGFAITPVVVWGGAAQELTLNTGEVASAHRIPMQEWLRDDAPKLSPAPDSEQPILRMPVGDDAIAAPTAAIIYQFRELCLLGRSTRVHHFEQPLFARK